MCGRECARVCCGGLASPQGGGEQTRGTSRSNKSHEMRFFHVTATASWSFAQAETSVDAARGGSGDLLPPTFLQTLTSARMPAHPVTHPAPSRPLTSSPAPVHPHTALLPPAPALPLPLVPGPVPALSTHLSRHLISKNRHAGTDAPRRQGT